MALPIFRVLPDNPSITDYCIPETSNSIIYPITSFEIVGVKTNTSSINSTDYYEDFTNVHFDVNAGDTYTVKIKGKNATSLAPDTYSLFIDWNQNGILIMKFTMKAIFPALRDLMTNSHNLILQSLKTQLWEIQG